LLDDRLQPERRRRIFARCPNTDPLSCHEKVILDWLGGRCLARWRDRSSQGFFIISSRVFLLFCFCGPRQVVDGNFQVGAFGRGRCERRDKSSGPPLLKLSLKVKRNSAHSHSAHSHSAHSQSSAFVVAPVSRPQRAWSLKGPPWIHQRSSQTRAGPSRAWRMPGP
jgi:hypothetical protein